MKTSNGLDSLLEGLKELSQNHLSKAVHLFNKSISKGDPVVKPAAKYYKAITESKTNTQEALATLNDLINDLKTEKDYNSLRIKEEALTLKLELIAGTASNEEIKEVCNEVLKINNKNTTALIPLIELEYLDNNLEQALMLIDDLEETGSDQEYNFFKGAINYEMGLESESYLKESLKGANPYYKSKAMNILSLIELQQGNVKEALSLLDESIRINNNFTAFYNKALILIDLMKYEEAERLVMKLKSNLPPELKPMVNELIKELKSLKY